MGIDRPNTPGGIIAVSDSTALAALDANGLPPGTRVFNAAVGSDFIYTISTAALDPDVIVEVFGTVGARWVLDVGGGGTVTGLDTTFIPASDLLVYAGPLSTALPTDNMYPRAARVVALWTGGELVTWPASLVVRCTTDGGKPAIGAPLYLAGAIDDTNTGAGKATATRPIIATPAPSGVPTNWARTVTPIGFCIDNALYDSAKTVVAALALPAQAEAASVPNQSWSGAAFFPMTDADYFSTAGNLQTELQWNIGQTLGIIFTVEDTGGFVGGPALWSNANAGITEGWDLCVSGGTLQVRQFSVLGNTFGTFASTPGFGLCCLFATIVPDGANGQMRSVLCDSLGTVANFTTIANPIVPPTVASSHRLGGKLIAGGTGWLPGSIIGIVKLNRIATDAEMRLWAEVTHPKLPGPNRYQFHPDVIADLDKQFHCLAKDWGGGAATLQATGGPAGVGFNFTTAGAPGVVAKGETMFRTVGPLLLDTEPFARDTRGGPHGDPVAAIRFTTAPDTQEICVGFRNDNPDNADNGAIVVNIDGVLTPFSSLLLPLADDVTAYRWYTILGAATDLQAHDVEILVADRLPYNPFSLYRAGTFLEAVIAGATQAFDGPATARRLLMFGDDDIIGHDAGGTFEPVTSWLRADYPGKVTAHAATTRGFGPLLDTFGGSMIPWARGIVEAGEEGAPATVDVWINLGFQDYARNSLTPTALATAYGALIDEIHRLRPTWTIYAQELIQAHYDAIANGGGFTLADFNTAIDGLAAGRAWLNVVDARVPNAIAFSAFIHPTQPAGATAWKNNIKTIIGY